MKVTLTPADRAAAAPRLRVTIAEHMAAKRRQRRPTLVELLEAEREWFNAHAQAYEQIFLEMAEAMREREQRP